MGAAAVRTLADVKEGDSLPELSVDVDATLVILGALASRDWRPMHHDRDFAIHRNGVKDIFMNTPNQAAWFERYVTDWSGPHGRLGRMKFRMKASVFPGDTMVFRGKVRGVAKDAVGCGWADLALELSVGERIVTQCDVRVALPTGCGDNPWDRKAGAWRP
jgi:acyl dehydratase